MFYCPGCVNLMDNREKSQEWYDWVKEEFKPKPCKHHCIGCQPNVQVDEKTNKDKCCFDCHHKIDAMIAEKPRLGCEPEKGICRSQNLGGWCSCDFYDSDDD